MKFPNIKSFPTFWENGMKLQAEHFQHLENSIEDSIRDVQATSVLGLESFGLLPNSEFSVRNAQGQSPQTVRVVLGACRAILPGGYRVEILPENIQKLQVPNQAPYVEFMPARQMRYHLFLSVGEMGRIPAGIPQTRPIRQPYLSYDYTLECVSNDRISAFKSVVANRMKVAEWQDGRIVEGYIPPTLTIRGFELLEKWHNYFQTQLENTARVAVHVINEHRNRDKPRAEFCQPIVHFIRRTQGDFRWLIPGQAPIHMAVYFYNFAGLVQGIMETSDRDFVRNRLKNGEINGLRTSINSLLKMKSYPQEDMAIILSRAQKFFSSLILTLQSLIDKQAPTPRVGDRT